MNTQREPLVGPIPVSHADGVLFVGRIYLVEVYHLDRVLGRITGTDGPRPGYIVFDILAVDSGPGPTVPDPSSPFRVAMDSDAIITEVPIDEIPAFLDMRWKTPAFDRALKGETP